MEDISQKPLEDVSVVDRRGRPGFYRGGAGILMVRGPGAVHGYGAYHAGPMVGGASGHVPAEPVVLGDPIDRHPRDHRGGGRLALVEEAAVRGEEAVPFPSKPLPQVGRRQRHIVPCVHRVPAQGLHRRELERRYR